MSTESSDWLAPYNGPKIGSFGSGSVLLIPEGTEVPLPPINNESDRKTQKVREYVIATPKGDIIPAVRKAADKPDEGQGNDMITVNGQKMKEGIASQHPLQNYSIISPDSIENEDAQAAGIPDNMKNILEDNGAGDAPAAAARDLMDTSAGDFSTEAPSVRRTSGGYMYSDGTVYDPIMQRRLNFFNMNRERIYNDLQRERGPEDGWMEIAQKMEYEEFVSYLRRHFLGQSRKARREHKKEIAKLQTGIRALMDDIQYETNDNPPANDLESEDQQKLIKKMRDKIEEMNDEIKKREFAYDAETKNMTNLRGSTQFTEEMEKIIERFKKYEKFERAGRHFESEMKDLQKYGIDHPEYTNAILDYLENMLNDLDMTKWTDALKIEAEEKKKPFASAIAGEIVSDFMTTLSNRFKSQLNGSDKELNFEFNRIIDYYSDKMTDEDALNAFTLELMRLFNKYNDNYDVRKVIEENMSDVERIHKANRVFTEIMQNLGTITPERYGELMREYTSYTTPYMTNDSSGPFKEAIRRRILELQNDADIIGGAAAHYAKYYRMMTQQQINAHNEFVNKIKAGRIAPNEESNALGLRMVGTRIPTTEIGVDTRTEDQLQADLSAIPRPGGTIEEEQENIEALEAQLGEVMAKVNSLGVKDYIRPDRDIDYEEEIEDLAYFHVERLENYQKFLKKRNRDLEDLMETEIAMDKVANECAKMSITMLTLSGLTGVPLPHFETRTKDLYMTVRYFNNYLNTIQSSLKDLLLHADNSGNIVQTITNVKAMKEQIELLKARLNNSTDEEWIQMIKSFQEQNKKIYDENVVFRKTIDELETRATQLKDDYERVSQDNRDLRTERGKKDGMPEFSETLGVPNKAVDMPQPIPKGPKAQPSAPKDVVEKPPTTEVDPKEKGKEILNKSLEQGAKDRAEANQKAKEILNSAIEGRAKDKAEANQKAKDILNKALSKNVEEAVDSVSTYLDKAAKALNDLNERNAQTTQAPNLVETISAEELVLRMEPSPRLNILMASLAKSNPDNPTTKAFVRYHLAKRKAIAEGMDQKAQDKMFIEFYQALSSVYSPESEIIQGALAAINTQAKIQSLTPEQARELEAKFGINKELRQDLDDLTSASMLLDIYENPSIYQQDHELANTVYQGALGFDDGDYNIIFDTFAMRVAEHYALTHFGSNQNFDGGQVVKLINVFTSAQKVLRQNMQSMGAQADMFNFFKSMLEPSNSSFFQKVVDNVSDAYVRDPEGDMTLPQMFHTTNSRHPGYFRSVVWKVIRARLIKKKGNNAFRATLLAAAASDVSAVSANPRQAAQSKQSEALRLKRERAKQMIENNRNRWNKFSGKRNRNDVDDPESDDDEPNRKK